jgi:hypothetical protein
MDRIVRAFFKDTDGNLPLLLELEAISTVLLLLNSHFSITYHSPLMSNIVQFGGLHIKDLNKLSEVSMGKITIIVNLH